MIKPSQADIDHFLSARRIAVIGVSRTNGKFSRQLFRELLKQGYDAIPVNPLAEELDGKVCHKAVKDISPVPERAVIILPKDRTDQALSDCAEAGIRDVWLLPIGHGNDRVLAQARQQGLNLIAGVCMFMFLPHATWVHRLHGGFLKLVGTYPK